MPFGIPWKLLLLQSDFRHQLFSSFVPLLSLSKFHKRKRFFWKDSFIVVKSGNQMLVLGPKTLAPLALHIMTFVRFYLLILNAFWYTLKNVIVFRHQLFSSFVLALSLFQNSTKKDFSRRILSLWSKVVIKCWYLALRLCHHWHYISWHLLDFICLY